MRLIGCERGDILKYNYKGDCLMRAPLLVLLFLSVIAAEPEGDFAPLALGNRWEYTYEYTSMSGRDSCTYSIQVVTSDTQNDTTVYTLQSGGTMYHYSVDEGADSSYQWNTETTLYEYGDTVFPGNNAWVCASGMPVADRHFIDSAVSGYIVSTPGVEYQVYDSLYEVNGKGALKRILHNNDVDQAGTETRVYHTGVGLVSSSSMFSYMGFSTIKTSTQVSFANEPVVSVTTPRLLTPGTGRRVMAPEKRLVLPCLTIVRGSRMFDLQGRSGRYGSHQHRNRLPLLHDIAR